MTERRISSEMAKKLPFPVIRPLATIFACMREFGSSLVPWPKVLLKEYSANLENIIEVLSHLALKKGIQDADLSALLEEIKSQISYPNVELFEQMTRKLSDFCSRHSEVLKAAATEEKDALRELYQKKAYSRKVLFMHSGKGKEKNILGSLTRECFYHVKDELFDRREAQEADYQVTTMYVSDPEEIKMLQKRKLHEDLSRLSLLLFDVDKVHVHANMQNLRSLFQVAAGGVNVLYRPFPTLRLLQEFERAYIHYIGTLGRMAEDVQSHPDEDGELFIPPKSLDEVYAFYQLGRV
jgi:hypothetical protein